MATSIGLSLQRDGDQMLDVAAWMRTGPMPLELVLTVSVQLCYWPDFSTLVEYSFTCAYRPSGADIAPGCAPPSTHRLLDALSPGLALLPPL